MHSGPVGRQDGTEGGGGAAGEEVSDELAGGVVGAASQLEGFFLPVALKLDTGQRASGVVVGRDADDDAGVGVPFVAGVLAHAVGDHAAGLRGRRDHGASGAHAEAVDRAAVAAVVDELVVGGAEERVPGLGSEAAAVDERLRVLDAEADREGLRFEEDSTAREHLEGVSRTVADREDDMIRRQALAAGENDAADFSILKDQVLDPAAQADLSSQGFDLGAQAFHYLHQAEGADVRLVDVEDLGGRSGGDELGEHFASAVPGVFDLAVELAVRKGAGSAFAELDVRFRIEVPFAPEAEGVDGALADLLAALEDDRPEARLGQEKAGEETAGAGADDDRPR